MKLPDFPLDALPPIPRAFVEATSAATGVDPSGLAITTLVALGAAIDGRTQLQLAPGFAVGPRLSILTVNAPMDRRSAMLQAALDPLLDYERRDRLRHAAQVTRGRKPKGYVTPSPPLRLVSDDPGYSALATVLARQPRGLLIRRDEITGWLDMMETSPAQPGRTLFTRALDGYGQSLNRVRAPVELDPASVGILAGIHRERLAALADLPAGGLLARMTPVILQSADPGDGSDPGEAQAGFGLLVEALIERPPIELTLGDAEAQETMDALRARLHVVASEAQGGLQAHLARLPAVAGSLAIALHFSGDFANDPAIQTRAEAVTAIIGWLVAHARAFADALALALAEADAVETPRRGGMFDDD